MLCKLRPRYSYFSTLLRNSYSISMSEPDEEIQAEDIYSKAHDHWSSVASDVDGMLGGFAHLHAPDISASKAFIQALKKSSILLNTDRALDCGSGIGRVTKHLLLPLFKQVDMVDFASQFLDNSRKYIGEHDFKRVGRQFVDSLHTFEPELNRYDLIWVQWVSGHLSDDHFIGFLRRCHAAIKQGGCVVFKENIATGDKKDFDEEDQSWTRPRSELLELFEEGRFEVVGDKRQENFPKGMYEVRMFALKPRISTKDTSGAAVTDPEAIDKTEDEIISEINKLDLSK